MRNAAEISWKADGSFSVGAECGRVLGWARDADILAAFMARLGLDVAAGRGALAGGPAAGEPPTYPPAQWRYPFDFSADIDRLTANDQHLDAVLDHLSQIRCDIPASEAGLNAWIAHRTRQLQEHSPQVAAVESFGGSYPVEDLSTPRRRMRGHAEYCAWIDPRLVIATPDPIWNDFNRRPETVPTIVRAARDASDDVARRAWVLEMFSIDPPDVVRVEGPAGPIYSLGSGGSHRTHAARILDLPYMVAEVHLAELPYPTTPGYLPGHPTDAMDRVWRRLRKRNMWTASIIDSDVAGMTWVPQAVTAEWMLLEPELATSVNRSYEQLYPGALTKRTGLSVDQLTDELAWLNALTTPTWIERAVAFIRPGRR